MLRRNSKKTIRITIVLILFLFSIFYFPALNDSAVKAEPSIQNVVSSSEESKPIIIYYSRTGKTRIVANELMNQLSCEIKEIKSTINREAFYTCALDSLLDREDKYEPFNKDLKGYNPIFLASPIWLRKISSPVRTFIKQGWLKGKNVYFFLTYNGNLSKEKEDILKKEITSQGIKLKGLYKVITKEKTDEEIKKDISTQLEKRPIATQKVASSTL
ncbi:MAG: hypothetical protein V3R78_15355 [Thermodesulfobacteriota bacterium]